MANVLEFNFEMTKTSLSSLNEKEKPVMPSANNLWIVARTIS